MIRLSLLGRAILIATLLLLVPVRATFADKRSDKVDKIFEKWDRKDSPGCALAIIENGKIIYSRGYGMANLDYDIPISPSSVFHIASISKQFTNFAIVLLAQEGKLSLDDPARKHIPELPDYGKPLTLRHLIHHTSGIRDQWDLLQLAGWRMEDVITQQDALDLIYRQKELNFPPGSEHLYCNSGYTLLAKIVLRTSGKNLREFCQERIFGPLGMTSTHFHDDHGLIVKNRATAYTAGPGGTFEINIPAFDTVGATSLFTTVEDLAKWDENFYNPKVGGAKAIEQMLERGKLNSGETIDYAFGLVRGVEKGLPTVSHGGADAGYRSHFLRFPEQHFSVVVLANTPIPTANLTSQAAAVYLGDRMKSEVKKPEEKPVPAAGMPSEADLKALAGPYQITEGGGLLRLTVGLGKLRLIGMGEILDLTPLGGSRFKAGASADPIEIEFSPSADGKRASGKLTAGGKTRSLAPVDSFNPTADQLAEYAGEYASSEVGSSISILAKEGKLLFRRKKQDERVLQPRLPDEFSAGWTITFTRDASKKINGFNVNTGRTRKIFFARVDAGEGAK